MVPRRLVVALLLGGCCFFWIYIVLSYVHAPDSQDNNLIPGAVDELTKKVEKMSLLVREEQAALRALRSEFEAAEEANERLQNDLTNKVLPLTGPWPAPIPILVFVCNRAGAITTHLEHLIRKRPSAERFPIVVSQDCDSEEVRAVVQQFARNVTYIKHVSGAKVQMNIPPAHLRYATYYRIARHYKLGLDHVFNTLGYTSVIITEDDLDVSDDFFEYFGATRKLLATDRSLWCVTAWNDNGKPELIDDSDPGRLYRSDFFAGLGWMMASDLWREIGPIWPTGFWDDWMRDPDRRKGRACIRPEISRTAMTMQGRTGASRGLFFEKHLIKVELNRRPVNFSRVDLRYLTKEKYDDEFIRLVYDESALMTIGEAQRELIAPGEPNSQPIRIEYNANLDYIRKADALHAMHDFKAGVPRTAYKGVVSVFINGRRVFLAPDRAVIKTYDPAWHVPDSIPE